MTILLILLLIVVLVAGGMIYARNSLVSANNRVEEAYSTMDVYMKKRYDLIPNLVNVVKGYAEHEKETLTAVSEASKKAAGAMTIGQQEKDEAILNGAVGKLFALAQAYPDLKANQTYQELQKQLETLEDDIAKSRKYYNAAVREYNNKISSFPGSLFAGKLHYEKKPYFQVSSQAERQNVKVAL